MQKSDFIKGWLACGTVMSGGGGRLLLGWGKRRWKGNPSFDGIKPQFYFPDYFLKAESPWFEHEHNLEMTPGQLLDLLSPYAPSASSCYVWNNPYRDFFCETFHDLQKKFATQEIAKAVPFVFESTPSTMQQSQLVRSLQSLLRYISINPAYLYGFWDEKEGMLGATPEVLFRYADEHKLETMACAGTKSTSCDVAAFLKDPKELHEHELVVQGIMEALSPYGRVKVDPLELLKLSRLIHFVTPIHIDFQVLPSVAEIVHVLHPTPAVGGFPRKQGMEWLLSYQRHIDRRRFGAPTGYLLPNSKQVNCYVCIRNVQWDGKQMLIGAGCGLIAESQLDREWEEINLKLRAIKEMLVL